jgi:hypothetical protein
MLRLFLVGVGLFAFAPASFAQLACPIPPVKPSQADFDKCKACLKKEYDDRQATLFEQGWGIFAGGATGSIVTSNPAGCLGAIPVLVAALVKAEVHGIDERRKCMTTSECQKADNYKQNLKQYVQVLQKYKEQQEKLQKELAEKQKRYPKSHCFIDTSGHVNCP